MGRPRKTEVWGPETTLSFRSWGGVPRGGLVSMENDVLHEGCLSLSKGKQSFQGPPVLYQQLPAFIFLLFNMALPTSFCGKKKPSLPEGTLRPGFLRMRCVWIKAFAEVPLGLGRMWSVLGSADGPTGSQGKLPEPESADGLVALGLCFAGSKGNQKGGIRILEYVFGVFGRIPFQMASHPNVSMSQSF